MKPGLVLQKMRKAASCARVFASIGIPRTAVYFGEALGDDLLCTAVLHELRTRGKTGIWMFSKHTSLFHFNPDVDEVVSPEAWDAAKIARANLITPIYTERDEQNDYDFPPIRHIITTMCAHAGITGRISVRPYLHLSEEERLRGQIGAGKVVIQSAARGARWHMENKEWYPERFQSVVDTLSGELEFLQLGTVSDPPLRGVVDLRGKTSVRESAAILASATLFVGLVGFLMHLTRAVERRSVIVYGGREAAWQSGYTCNENLETRMHCSPCWRWNACDYGHQCMRSIEPDAVISAIRRAIARNGEPLKEDVDNV